MRALRALVRTFRRSKKLTVGTVLLIVMILIGAFSHNIVTWIGQGSNPLYVGWGRDFSHSSFKDPLGTDSVGRNIMALTVTGLWTSLKVAFFAGLISTVIGVVVAFFAAYIGGILDAILRTVTDTFLVIPALPLLIAFSGFAKTVSLLEISVIIAVFSWAGAARAIRSQVLSLRTRSYVDLAKMTKLSTPAIIFEELVPNMFPYIVLGLAVSAIGAIFFLASLEIIGLGPSNLIDLGLIINNGYSQGAFTLGDWTLFIAPIVAICLLFVSLNMINIGLDEVFNPRLRKVAGV
jgi:peptide/nickel transport system permease protein